MRALAGNQMGGHLIITAYFFPEYSILGGNFYLMNFSRDEQLFV